MSERLTFWFKAFGWSMLANLVLVTMLWWTTWIVELHLTWAIALKLGGNCLRCSVVIAIFLTIVESFPPSK